MKKYQKIEGVLHDINVSIVTQKYLNSLVANKNESVDGCYVPDENLIYIAKSLDDSNKIHTLLHELYHSFEEHTTRMEREAKADSFAALLMRIFKPKTLEELFKK